METYLLLVLVLAKKNILFYSIEICENSFIILSTLVLGWSCLCSVTELCAYYLCKLFIYLVRMSFRLVMTLDFK